MSHGQLARTPINFPHMRYRAARRHERAAFSQPRSRRARPMCSIWMIPSSEELIHS